VLRGIYRPSGQAVGDLTVAGTLTRASEADRLWIEGPFAIATNGAGSRAVSGDVACAFEGHLYDRSDLEGELGIDGRSEAELVVRGYRRYGEELLTRLRGSYALGLWDRRRREGLLTCDLLATQSMFVWQGPGYLVFASELLDLISLLPSQPSPDPVGFLSWVGGWCVPDGHTLYEGISRLGVGELVELVGDGGTTTRPYWEPQYAGTLSGSREELAEELLTELERAVAKRLSSRSSGVVLSGGIDSSTVTAIADRVKPADTDLRTYSVVFPGEECDETWKVRSLADTVGIEPKLFELEPQGGLWDCLHRIKRWGVPLMTNAALIDLTMTREAGADGTGVVLDGQTGDELFGHSPYLLADQIAHGRFLAAAQLTRRWPAPGRPTTWRERRLALKSWGLIGAAPYRLHRFVRRRKDASEVAPPWLLPQHRRRFAELKDRWEWKAGGSGPRWWRYQVDQIVRGPHRLLRLDFLRQRARDGDARSEPPLYDFDLIDFILRVPPRFAFDWERDRPLARRALDGILPEDVRLQKRKAVFSPFCYDMLTGAEAPGVERLLTAPDAELGAYVDLEGVRRLWREDRPRRDRRYGTMAWGANVWVLVAAECWLRSQSNPGFIDEMLSDPDVRPPQVRQTLTQAI